MRSNKTSNLKDAKSLGWEKFFVFTRYVETLPECTNIHLINQCVQF